MASILPTVLLAAGFIQSIHGAALHVARDGASPALIFDPNTTQYCTWWIDLNTAQSCPQILSDNLIDLATFRRWNPSITENCGNLLVGHSYCVEAYFEPITTTAPPTTSIPTPTSSVTTTTTTPGNGITTPLPTQAGMVTNCNKFHLVENGQSCAVIASLYSISSAQFVAWNPAAKSDCTGLWAATYACVGVIAGATPTTTAGNGISTPSPTQPGMVSDCDSFYYVVSGDTCATIASKSGISVSQFVSWNPSVGNTCSGLWLDAYVCISILGHSPSPTAPGNGIATPTPIQDGMIKSCKTFHFVTSGETCAAIAAKYGITSAQFVSWNPAVGSSCMGMWANTYACVAVL